jgi:hypothetical protein
MFSNKLKRSKEGRKDEGMKQKQNFSKGVARFHSSTKQERKESEKSEKKRQRQQNKVDDETRNTSKKTRNENNRQSKLRGPPSNEALELSAELKKLSREKKWDKAIELYRDTSNDKIRDGHHACIMVDMSARCGKISVSFVVGL